MIQTSGNHGNIGISQEPTHHTPHNGEAVPERAQSPVDVVGLLLPSARRACSRSDTAFTAR